MIFLDLTNFPFTTDTIFTIKNFTDIISEENYVFNWTGRKEGWKYRSGYFYPVDYFDYEL